MDQTRLPVTAIVLAGGKSTRMGANKGLMPFGDKKLVEHVLDQVRAITDQVMIVANDPAYRDLGYPCVEDAWKDKGPLAGILTGLMQAPTDKILVVGCDMPFLTGDLLLALVNNMGDEEVLLAEHEGRPEPLCSIYDRRCIRRLQGALQKEQLKITDALAGLRTRVISFDGEPWFRGNEFANINTPEEREKYDSEH